VPPLEQPDPPIALVGPETITQMLALARLTPPDGCFVEVGVFQGGSAIHLHALAWEQRRNLYLYDTFGGMPYFDAAKGDCHPLGDFADTSYDRVQRLCPYAMIQQGVFPPLGDRHAADRVRAPRRRQPPVRARER
jgi:hypothetical protein